MKKRIFRSVDLTPEQYSKSNRTVALGMMLSYIVFFLTVLMKEPIINNVSKPIICIYLVVIFLCTIFYAQKNITKKKAMLFMVTAYAWAYASMAILFDAAFMPILFPVLLTLTCYLNEKLMAIGCGTSFLILLVKSMGVSHMGGSKMELGVCNTVFVGIVFCMVVGIKAIGVLIDFSNDAAETIAAKAEKQMEVARQVEEIVDELDISFHTLVDELTYINYSIDNTNNVIDQIAEGSENTAIEATHQAEMTGEIQSRLQNTSSIAIDAKVTTDDLRNVIVNGKAQSDELSHQSQLVDNNTAKISNTVENLVNNVSRVSDITDTILSISSQTNLLALNASIEAARAGEAGKGFAVVADEIRKLAEETKVSTEMITAIVNELIAVTNETQEGLAASVESINVQREKVKEVTSSFAEIEAGMVSLYGGMNTVNEEVGAVLDANQNIVDGISTLSGISEEISAQTSTSRGNMQALVDSMRKFSDVVEGTFTKLQELKETATVEG